MKKIKFLKKQLDNYFVYVITLMLFISCGDFERDFEKERYLSESHAEAIAGAGPARFQHLRRRRQHGPLDQQ